MSAWLHVFLWCSEWTTSLKNEKPLEGMLHRYNFISPKKVSISRYHELQITTTALTTPLPPLTTQSLFRGLMTDSDTKWTGLRRLLRDERTIWERCYSKFKRRAALQAPSVFWECMGRNFQVTKCPAGAIFRGGLTTMLTVLAPADNGCRRV